MSFQDILVHIRSSGSIEPVRVAMRVAKRFGAHLTGLYALHELALFKHILPDDSSKIREMTKTDYAAAAESEKRFRALADQESVAHSQWQIGEGDAAELLAIAARLQDLVIVGLAEHGEPGSNVAERMATEVGRPTLIVPSAGPFLDIGKRILVAWNGSAQAASAVLHAKPFLTAAERVLVLVGEGREKFPTITRQVPLDIIGYLNRHGIDAEIHPIGAPDADAGAAILKMAYNAESDLIVMGAFGRTRLREWVLGGATRQVLENLSVPVLMMH
jgi:nucleotide-binding universal stress UspA family protein